MIKIVAVTAAAVALECFFLKVLSSGVSEFDWQLIGDDYD